MPKARVRQKPRFKQMSLETAVRNPERYKDILSILVEYENAVLNDENLLEIVTHLYREGIVSALRLDFDKMTISEQKKAVKKVNSTRRADGGFPKGVASRFWTYVRTLSEFGFLYATYNEKLVISNIAKLLVKEEIDDQIAFATQAAIFNRKSPHRNVSNDYNYFKFITQVLIKLNKLNKTLSYEQFVVSLFSKNGNAVDFIQEINANTFLDDNAVYEYLVENYLVNNKIGTVTKDYPDAVIRLLKITGFISIKYLGKLKIMINHDKLEFIEKIFSNDYLFSDEQKLDRKMFYNQFASYSNQLIKTTASWTIESQEDVHIKLKRVVDDYNINIEKITILLSNFVAKRDREFKYVPDPLKLEFYLSILLYLVFGQDHIVAPNYKVDSLGMPISHAPGNHGDIYVYSDVINWLIEVTLIRNKQQQLNHETTSVIRHLEEDERDNYLSFVAPFIHADTKAFYDNEIIRMLLSDKLVYLETYSITDFVTKVLSMEVHDSMKNYTDNIIRSVRAKFSN